MLKGTRQSYRILVVDDDRSVLNMFKSLLEFDGHQPHTVDNGKAGLDLLEQNAFDLVITDYAMPGMAGDEFAALVKARWPDQPIIMASGSYAECTVVNSGVLCVDYFLCKPFLMDELRDAITQVLGRRGESEQTDPATLPNPDNLPGPADSGRRAESQN